MKTITPEWVYSDPLGVIVIWTFSGKSKLSEYHQHVLSACNSNFIYTLQYFHFFCFKAVCNQRMLIIECGFTLHNYDN